MTMFGKSKLPNPRLNRTRLSARRLAARSRPRFLSALTHRQAFVSTAFYPDYRLPSEAKRINLQIFSHSAITFAKLYGNAWTPRLADTPVRPNPLRERIIT